MDLGPVSRPAGEAGLGIQWSTGPLEALQQPGAQPSDPATGPASQQQARQANNRPGSHGEARPLSPPPARPMDQESERGREMATVADAGPRAW